MNLLNDGETTPSDKDIEGALEERFSKESYSRFKHAKVAIAGLGGLGSNIAGMLARTGIGHLHLVDFDKVELTNLNRQMYMIPHVGLHKTEALKEILKEINPYIKITTETIFVEEENIGRIFGEFPIVCEAFDQAEYKAMLVNTLLEHCPQTKIVASSGMAGFGSSNEIHTRRVMKNLYLSGDEKSDILDLTGLTAARVSICAGHQANMVIRLILGMEEV